VCVCVCVCDYSVNKTVRHYEENTTTQI